MRLLLLILVMLAGTLVAGEPTAYPLWDGSESVAEYAKKINLPPTKTLELGNNVKLELVLIPAGKFVMGTPEPTPVDEDGFQKRIVTGQALLAASAGALLVMLVVVIIRAIRKRQTPKYSLLWLLAITITAGGCVLSGLHWRESVKTLAKVREDFITAKARFDAANKDEKPAHQVTLTQPFYMGKYDVTQEQYQAVMGSNPSQNKGKDNPVEMVSWDEAQDFCKRLTALTTQTVRLPTEAEWEFACRAGTTTMYYSGDSENDLNRVAWYSGNSNGTTQPVGQREANAFGLYDMHGNVWQWCEDWWDDSAYSKSPTENSVGPTHYACHVMRGNFWGTGAMECRSAHRNLAVSPSSALGFRVVVVLAFRTQ